MNPEEWGLAFKNNGLESPPAPEKLLNTIFVIAKKVEIITVVVRQSVYFVHLYVIIVEASLAPMLNQIL